MSTPKATTAALAGHDEGRLILLSAPSGAGKTSLVEAALNSDPRLVVSISHTTRNQRPGEQDGVNYHFTDHETFNEMIQAGQFLEHALVFGQRYGTAMAQVEALLQAGRDVILEIDWQGAEQVQKLVPDALSIFILPPSEAELEVRLRGRGQDSNDSIQQRLAEARLDMSKAKSYDYIVVNDKFDHALAHLHSIFTASRLEAERQIHNQQHIRELLSC